MLTFKPNVMASKRKFTDEQRLEILQQAKEIGVIAAIRNHALSYSVFSRWRERLNGSDGSRKENILKNRARFELRQFMDENLRLKKIIADQALELERKNEELRRSMALYGT